MRPKLRILAAGAALVGVVGTAGCDTIWGVHVARLYVRDAGGGGGGGMGGTTSTSSTSNSSGGGTGGATGCTPGITHPCYSGPAGTENVGMCKPGVQTCNADGTGYGPCVGDITPTVEDCASQEDTNCDGFLCAETEWSQVVSTVGNDTWTAIANDQAGNVYVAGTFTGPMKIAGTTLVGFSGTDIFVAKLDPSGKLSWAKQFGDLGDQDVRAIAVDHDGNVVITGSTTGPVDFGKGAVNGLTYVLKLDASGSPLWSMSCGGIQPPSTYGVGGTGVAFDASGDVIVAGEFGGTANCGDVAHASAGGLDILLAKLSGKDGHALWSHSFGDSADQYVRGLAVDSAGNIVISGPENGSANFGGMPLVGAGFYLARFLPSGAHSWSRQWGTSTDYSLGVAVNSTGGPVVVGTYHSSSLDFGGGALAAPPPGGAGAFMLALDSNGSHVWSKGMVPASGQGANSVAVAVDSTDGVVATGGFSDSLDIDGMVLTVGGLWSNTFVASFDGAGSKVWVRAFSGTTASSVSPSSVAVAPTGAVSLVGAFEGSVDFGTGLASSSDPGTSDYFLLKLAPP